MREQDHSKEMDHAHPLDRDRPNRLRCINEMPDDTFQTKVKVCILQKPLVCLDTQITAYQPLLRYKLSLDRIGFACLSEMQIDKSTSHIE